MSNRSGFSPSFDVSKDERLISLRCLQAESNPSMDLTFEVSKCERSIVEMPVAANIWVISSALDVFRYAASMSLRDEHSRKR